MIETNTFGANRVKLAPFGLADQVKAINAQGAKIARQAAREQAFVAGAIGPLGIRIEPWGKTGVDEAEEYFREQAAALLEGGVDLFVLETFHDVNEIGARHPRRAQPLRPAHRRAGDDRRGRQHARRRAAGAFVPQLGALGATVDRRELQRRSGGDARDDRAHGARRARAAVGAAERRPAARDRGRNIYLSSPEYMASYARRFINNGVRLVGGCCGTTPEHIRHIKAAVRALSPAAAAVAGRRRGRAAPDVRRSPPPMPCAPEKSRLANALARRQFVVSVELLPPRGYDARSLVNEARSCAFTAWTSSTFPTVRARARG